MEPQHRPSRRRNHTSSREDVALESRHLRQRQEQQLAEEKDHVSVGSSSRTSSSKKRVVDTQDWKKDGHNGEYVVLESRHLRQRQEQQLAEEKDHVSVGSSSRTSSSKKRVVETQPIDDAVFGQASGPNNQCRNVSQPEHGSDCAWQEHDCNGVRYNGKQHHSGRGWQEWVDPCLDQHGNAWQEQTGWYSKAHGDEPGAARYKSPDAAQEPCDHGWRDYGDVPDSNHPFSGANASLGSASKDVQEIKARTMFRMVEDIDDVFGGTPRKLLFLTNFQAELLSGIKDCIPKLLEAFEVPKPRLFIQLHHSLGASQHTDVHISQEDFGSLLQRLEHFMGDVLIPLAAETQAIVICCANYSDCLLTEAFLNALQLQRAKWGSHVPFTLIGCTFEIHHMYFNPDQNAWWRKLMRKSKTWREHHKRLGKVAARYSAPFACDLDDRIPNLLVFDTVDEGRQDIGFLQPGMRLLTEIVRHLTHNLPGLSIKTGCSLSTDGWRNQMCSFISLQHALDSMHSSSPMLFLDSRDRTNIKGNASSIEQGIEEAKKSVEEFYASATSSDNTDWNDIMTAAFLHSIMRSGGEELSLDKAACGLQARTRVALHESIDRLCVDKNGARSADCETKPVDEYIQDIAQWFTGLHFSSAERLTRGVDRGFRAEYCRTFEAVLRHRNFHALNVVHTAGANELVRELVRLDRLPKEETIEGLMLLREAWDEYDVKMFLASRYKFISKLSYLALLVFGMLSVILTSLGLVSAICSAKESAAKIPQTVNDDLIHPTSAVLNCSPSIFRFDLQVSSWVVFTLNIATSFVMSLLGLFNPSQRWHRLRTSACHLESLIWQYRTRTGHFLPQGTRDLESELCRIIASWRKEVVAGTDLKMSSLEREYPKHVYKHLQYEGTVTSIHEDDFHTPVKANEYVRLRLSVAKKFYQKRIPGCIRAKLLYQCVAILCSLASATLTFWGHVSYVGMVSSLACAVTSWMEFVDLGSKIERYTTAIQCIKDLNMWWISLSELEQQAVDNISYLVEEAEAIITNERSTWHATSTRRRRTSNCQYTESSASTTDCPRGVP